MRSLFFFFFLLWVINRPVDLGLDLYWLPPELIIANGPEDISP